MLSFAGQSHRGQKRGGCGGVGEGEDEEEGAIVDQFHPGKWSMRSNNFTPLDTFVDAIGSFIYCCGTCKSVSLLWYL